MEHILDQQHLQTNKSTVRYGGFWQRFAAIMLDGLILAPITLGVTYFNIIDWKSIVVLVIVTILGVSYKPFMEANYGATLGKMALKLKVTNLDLQPANLQEVLLRNIFQIVPTFITLFLTIGVYNDPGFQSISGYGEFSLFSAQFKGLQYTNYALGLVGVIDAIVLLADSQKRSLHDKIAGTVVIES